MNNRSIDDYALDGEALRAWSKLIKGEQPDPPTVMRPKKAFEQLLDISQRWIFMSHLDTPDEARGRILADQPAVSEIWKTIVAEAQRFFVQRRGSSNFKILADRSINVAARRNGYGYMAHVGTDQRLFVMELFVVLTPLGCRNGREIQICNFTPFDHQIGGTEITHEAFVLYAACHIYRAFRYGRNNGTIGDAFTFFCERDLDLYQYADQVGKLDEGNMDLTW